MRYLVYFPLWEPIVTPFINTYEKFVAACVTGAEQLRVHNNMKEFTSTIAENVRFAIFASQIASKNMGIVLSEATMLAKWRFFFRTFQRNRLVKYLKRENTTQQQTKT